MLKDSFYMQKRLGGTPALHFTITSYVLSRSRTFVTLDSGSASLLIVIIFHKEESTTFTPRGMVHFAAAT